MSKKAFSFSIGKLTFVVGGSVASVFVLDTYFRDRPWTSAGQNRGRRRDALSASLDEHAFTPWTVVGSENVSPTSKIVRLRPPGRAWKFWDAAARNEKQQAGDGGEAGPRQPYEDLWRKGTWSLQFKQPQLMVAREYTPLPPQPVAGRAERSSTTTAEGNVAGKSQDGAVTAAGGSVGERAQVEGGQKATSVWSRWTSKLAHPPTLPPDAADLHFLIRRDGEVSKYVNALPLNAEVEVRGPRAELMLPPEDDPKVLAEVVFIAGGTGIAPAVQLAHGLMIREQEEKRAAEGKFGAENGVLGPGIGTRMTVLWASRRREECYGGDNDTLLGDDGASGRGGFLAQAHAQNQKGASGWFGFFPSKSTDANGALPPGSAASTSQAGIGAQISSMRIGTSIQPAHPMVKHLTDLRSAFAQARLDRAQTAQAQDVTITTSGSPTQVPMPTTPLLEVGYFIDAERTSIQPALLRQLFTRPSLSLPHTSAQQRGDNMMQQSKHGKPYKMVIVSGPPGFVEHFAGPKEFRNGLEVQGPLGGVLGKLMEEGCMEGWSVYKL